MASTEKGTHDDVKEYYGKTLQRSDDLKTNACTIAGRLKMAKSVRQALADVHDEVKSTFYGCGMTIPTHIEGSRILDLGSGSGLDCFAISKLVGQKGSVVGVDMTDEQLAIAHKYEDYHREKFGYEEKNTQFVKGYIEDLLAAGLKDGDFDIVVSNCVVNLSLDKRAVLKEVYRVLKSGGELYFSDMYTERELPEQVKNNKMLWGEGLAGALSWKDLVSFSKECGFTTPRLVSANQIDVYDKQVASIIGEIKYASATYRMFKLPEGYTSEEANATYIGSLKEYEKELPFDCELTFKTDNPVKVDAELSAILQLTRYSSIFQVTNACKKKPKADCSPCDSSSKVPTDPFCFLQKQDGKGDCQKGASNRGCCGGPAKTCSPPATKDCCS